MKLLTAYVRENTQWLPNKEIDASSSALLEEAPEGPLYSDAPSPRADIQGILDVVSNLHVHQEDDLEVRFRQGTVIDLRGSNLEGAYFGGANLWLDILTKVNLQHADLSEANLRGAWLEGSNLEGVYMRKTNLYGARLEGTNLERAKSFTQEQIEQAIGTENTRLPEYLTMPEAWRDSVFEQHNRLIVGGM